MHGRGEIKKVIVDNQEIELLCAEQDDLQVAQSLLKSLVFGMLIGSVACSQGLRATVKAE